MINKKFAILGGGHGLSNVLQALKFEKNIKAIVSTANSGGSTGKLRKTFNCPAMGDIRKCLSTLSDSPMVDLFEKRTDNNDCIGNLIIGGLAKLYYFDYAIKKAHKILEIPETKKVIPISLDNYDIQSKYQNGKICKNEVEFNQIDKIEKIWLNPIPKANPEALQALKEADYVILAPGSFYTSVLVNLEIPEIKNILKFKPVIWIANLMQEKYETLNYTLLDLYNLLLTYCHIDVVIMNNRIPTKNMLLNYKDYLKPLLKLNLKNISIIKSPLLKCENKILTHSIKNTYEAIQKAIRILK